MQRTEFHRAPHHPPDFLLLDLAVCPMRIPAGRPGRDVSRAGEGDGAEARRERSGAGAGACVLRLCGAAAPVGSRVDIRGRRCRWSDFHDARSLYWRVLRIPRIPRASTHRAHRTRTRTHPGPGGRSERKPHITRPIVALRRRSRIRLKQPNLRLDIARVKRHHRG